MLIMKIIKIQQDWAVPKCSQQRFLNKQSAIYSRLTESGVAC